MGSDKLINLQVSMAPSSTNFLNNMSSVSFHMERQTTKVSDILKCRDGTFNVSGQLTWQREVRQPGSSKHRDAFLTNDSR